LTLLFSVAGPFKCCGVNATGTFNPAGGGALTGKSESSHRKGGSRGITSAGVKVKRQVRVNEGGEITGVRGRGVWVGCIG